jgi:hypothetical protein
MPQDRGKSSKPKRPIRPAPQPQPVAREGRRHHRPHRQFCGQCRRTRPKAGGGFAGRGRTGWVCGECLAGRPARPKPSVATLRSLLARCYSHLPPDGSLAVEVAAVLEINLLAADDISREKEEGG